MKDSLDTLKYGTQKLYFMQETMCLFCLLRCGRYILLISEKLLTHTKFIITGPRLLLVSDKRRNDTLQPF